MSIRDKIKTDHLTPKQQVKRILLVDYIKRLFGRKPEIRSGGMALLTDYLYQNLVLNEHNYDWEKEFPPEPLGIKLILQAEDLNAMAPDERHDFIPEIRKTIDEIEKYGLFKPASDTEEH
jgi:hypothetical protein